MVLQPTCRDHSSLSIPPLAGSAAGSLLFAQSTSTRGRSSFLRLLAKNSQRRSKTWFSWLWVRSSRADFLWLHFKVFSTYSWGQIFIGEQCLTFHGWWFKVLAKSSLLNRGREEVFQRPLRHLGLSFNICSASWATFLPSIQLRRWHPLLWNSSLWRFPLLPVLDLWVWEADETHFLYNERKYQFFRGMCGLG